MEIIDLGGFFGSSLSWWVVQISSGSEPRVGSGSNFFCVCDASVCIVLLSCIQNFVFFLIKKSKVHYQSINFLSCVIPVHKLLKCVTIVPKFNLGLKFTH
jgi:hypothetical protein